MDDKDCHEFLELKGLLNEVKRKVGSHNLKFCCQTVQFKGLKKIFVKFL